MKFTTRDGALMLVEQALYAGTPMHPNMLNHLREIIGETTPEEEARMRSYRLAGEAAAERSREQLRQLAEVGERFRASLRGRSDD